MPSKSYTLNFEGYRLSDGVGTLPSKPGIYCIYSCKYNIKFDQVTDLKLLYIGEAENLKKRIEQHNKSSEFNKQLTGKELCYSRAILGKNFNQRDRVLIEHALVYHHQPICNEKLKNNFPNEISVKIQITGRHYGLDSEFEI